MSETKKRSKTTRGTGAGVAAEKGGSGSGGEVVKKRPGNNKEGSIRIKAKPGEISKFIKIARVPFSLPPIDVSDEAQVAARVEAYFNFCEENDVRPGVVMLGNWLGVGRNTLMEWRRGIVRKGQKHGDIIEKAINLIDALWEQYMLEGKINVVGGIFLGKALLGYRESQEIVVKSDDSQDVSATPEELARRYVDSLPDAEAYDENGEPL